MKHLKHLWAIGGMFGGFVALACGGESDEGSSGTTPPTFDTGVADSQVLGELSEEERAAWCDSVSGTLFEYMTRPSMRDGYCRFAGALGVAFTGADTDEAAQQACTQIYDACIDGETTTESPSGSCATPSAECRATAGEVEACFAASMALLGDVFSQMPACTDLKADDVTIDIDGANDADADPLADPPECVALHETCPEVFASPEDDEL